MNQTEYEAWVGRHCDATAASHEAAVALVSQFCREAFVEWRATATELDACTRSLIRHRRVPKFANEHADAVSREMFDARGELAKANRPDPAATYPIGGAVPDSHRCRWCRDTGMVTVPLYLCVEVPRDAPPRLVPHPGYRSVLVGSVLCDQPDCDRGRATRGAESKAGKPRPTLRKYLARLGGVNVVELLERHERETAEHARRTASPGANPFAEVIARLRARANGTYTEAA